MNILFYTPLNHRARDTESLMIAFRQGGHRVFSLSQCEAHEMHNFIRSKGIETFSYQVKATWMMWFFLKHVVFMVSFCRRHKIDIVYSHLEPANFVTVVSQYFIRSKCIVVRHHVNEGALYGFDKTFSYRAINKLAKQIVVVSSRARRYMVEEEGVSDQRIAHINLGYDFGLYDPIDESKVSSLKKLYDAEVLLLTVCRLTKYKRPEVAIQTLDRLRKSGVNAKLVVLGSGDMHGELIALGQSCGVENALVFPGYVSNVLDYMAAADFLLHPSILESSCVVVKEAGLARLPVIVCKDIGDFEEYIIHGTNGFMVDKNSFVDEATDIVRKHKRTSEVKVIGENLDRDIRRIFSVEQAMKQYDALNLEDE